MLKISKIPDGEPVSTLFTATVDGENAPAKAIRVSAYPYNYGWPGHQRPEEQSEDSAYIAFESDKPVRLSVKPGREFCEAVVRPLSKGIKPEREGGGLVFTLEHPGQYSLELDGHHNNLHIFFDAPREYAEDGVIYYGPGVHNTGVVRLYSGDTVVIDRDAVVVGGFFAVDAENVKITGKGVIDGRYENRTNDTLLLAVDVQTWGHIDHGAEGFMKFMKRTDLMTGNIKLYNCRNCVIEGIICVDSAAWAVSCYACSDLHIDGIKEVGQWKYNTDGIDLMNCRDVLVENCFLRNYDDCMVLKGIKGWDGEDLYNITMRNLVIWCDWGRALEIGAETCADEYHGILFEDCDVIHAVFSMLDIQNGDRAYVHDVTFDNIRCEFTKYQQQDVLQTDMTVPYPDPQPAYQPRLIFIHGYTGQWSKDGIPGKTSDILFRNIMVYPDTGMTAPEIDICGFSEGHGVERVTFDGIFMNGKRLTRGDIKWTVGHHVGELDFI